MRALDVKVTEIQPTVEKLKADVYYAKRSSSDDNGDTLPTTTRFQTMPRSVAVVATSDTRAIVSSPSAAPSVAHPANYTVPIA